jgi:polyisoprenoid-binding protein YceI
MHRFCALAALFGALILAAPLVAAADNYTVDGMHSIPSFTFRHLELSSFRGRFDKLTGAIEFDPAQHTGSADIVIAIDSVSTGVPMLDQCLKGPRFFDAARFPSATCKCREHPLLKVPSCGADASVTLKRSDFGLDAFIGNDSDEVRLDIAVEALKAQKPQ